MQRPSWVWAALPPDSRRVACLDDTGLAAALRETGIEVDPCVEENTQDAVLVDEKRPDAAMAAARGAATATSGVTAVAMGPNASPSLRPVSRLARAMQMLASPVGAARTEAAARRVERTLARAGLQVHRIRTGDRSLPRYGLGPGGWLKRRRLPGGAIVIGSTGPRPASVIEEVVSAAARDLGKPLRRLSTDVFPSGKLAVELAGAEDEPYFLSITAGDTGGLDRSDAAINAILGADSPASVRERIVEPLVAGQVGPVRYVLEPKAPGRHPVWMSAGLWEQSVEFLADLHRLPHRAPALSLPAEWPDLPTAVDILSKEASQAERRLLGRIHEAIRARTGMLEVGGGHGDFFTKNLLVEGGDLRAVLDWEWAARDCLPLLDLFDLRAQLGWRRRRGLRVGQNFTDVLWPLVRQGGDGPLRAYSEAIGMPSDVSILEGLAIAHWLLRTARLGSINPRRLEDAGWRRTNVEAPIAKIVAEAL